jgi:hypothetical protein
MSLAMICALSAVALTYIVLRGEPFQFTTEELLKFVPLAVRVNAPLPGMTDIGEIAVSTGAGFGWGGGGELPPPPQPASAPQNNSTAKFVRLS